MAPAGREMKRRREENTGNLLKENSEKGGRIKKWKEFKRGVGGKLELSDVIDFVLKATTRKGKELPTRREGLRREEDQARIQNGSEILPNICSVDVRKIVRNTVKSVDIDAVESLTGQVFQVLIFFTAIENIHFS